MRWTLKRQSFLHHGLASEADREFTPILIGCDGDPGEESQVLINLFGEVPAFFRSFERLCELIDQDATVREAGRERYA